MKENKMKIAVASDIHLEFGPVEFENPGVDVLILSGDITTANKIEFHMDFFDMCADRKSTRLNSSHVSESRMPSSA